MVKKVPIAREMSALAAELEKTGAMEKCYILVFRPPFWVKLP